MKKCSNLSFRGFNQLQLWTSKYHEGMNLWDNFNLLMLLSSQATLYFWTIVCTSSVQTYWTVPTLFFVGVESWSPVSFSTCQTFCSHFWSQVEHKIVLCCRSKAKTFQKLQSEPKFSLLSFLCSCWIHSISSVLQRQKAIFTYHLFQLISAILVFHCLTYTKIKENQSNSEPQEFISEPQKDPWS